LQRLSQGNLSVDEYYKEMELLMIRTETAEATEATMARFFNGLNLEVQDRVEMTVYYNIEDLVHQAQRAEQQIKRRGTTSNTWRRLQHQGDDIGTSSKMETLNRLMFLHARILPNQECQVVFLVASLAQISKYTLFHVWWRGHMKHSCPNAKRVLLTQDGYISASDEDEIVDMSSEKSEGHEKETMDGFEAAASYPSLMVQRVQEDKIEDKGQRWNIFESMCKINDVNCKMIIDGGSYTNAVSKGLVEALKLPVWKHPQPHCVEWLYHTGNFKVTHKMRVNFSVGDYADRVICDVVPMDACHLLLGRPWQYDHSATHEDRSNSYSFWDSGKRRVLLKVE
jgi:hypothetical protein